MLIKKLHVCCNGTRWREAAREETGRPPETKLTKDSRARCLGSQWTKLALEMGGEGEETRTEGGLDSAGEGSKDDGVPQWHLISLPLSCSASPYFPPFFSQ